MKERVVLTAAFIAKGQDLQLERGIQGVLRMLSQKPPVQPERLPYQNRALATQ